jgi:hypothetical protein
MIRYGWSASIVVCVGVALSCQESLIDPNGTVDPMASWASETWLHAPPVEVRNQLLGSVPHYKVVESYRAETLALVSTTPCRRIAPDEARRLAGVEISACQGAGMPVLLRCVEVARDRSKGTEGDRSRVSWNAGTVLVDYMAQRSRYMPLRRAAVIAVLPSEPREVYVNEHTAVTGGVR